MAEFMEKEFVFLLPSQAHMAYELIRERMDWMERNQIHQWVKGEYDKAYPESYFADKAAAHQLVGIELDGRLIATAVILDKDSRWGETTDKAIYIHCLAGSTSFPGAGRCLIERIEGYAKKQGYQYARLDSIRTSKRLFGYYASLGYIKVGEGEEPYYRFNLYQKELR